uniref:Proteasome activator complex subunit 4-like HEAT repeat-like domain-containing protein n=1 Tax=Romanomermis culicivorax TaxID=13658 RepID=A0A915JHB0_ROMCU
MKPKENELKCYTGRRFVQKYNFVFMCEPKNNFSNKDVLVDPCTCMYRETNKQEKELAGNKDRITDVPRIFVDIRIAVFLERIFGNPNLCRTFGPQCIQHFKPIMEKFVKSSKLCEQRFASEFVCGVISGSKFWSFEQCDEFWRHFMSNLLKSAFENLTSKNFNDWGVCLATIFDSRDPKKLFWFLDLLIELVKKPIESSFNAASRLFLLQGALHQQEWRILPLWHDVLQIIEPLLCQPYQNLRDRLGSVLSTIFSCDIEQMTCENVKFRSPDKKAFLRKIHQRLEILYKEVEVGHPSDASATLYGNGDSKERQDAVLLFKTMLCFLNTQWATWFALPNELIDFLPLLCYFENETSDDELKRDCRAQLMRGLARAWLGGDTVDRVLENCEK